MVKRLGVGATAASSVIFSILLVSDLMLFAASQNRATLYSQSDASDLLGDEAAVLAGAAATNILLEAQSAVSSAPMRCPTASADIAADIRGLADVQRSGLLTVSATAREAPEVGSGDNLTMVSPFNGSIAGELSMSLGFTERSDLPLAGVVFGRFDTHLVHLPVRWASAVRDCLEAVATISQAVAGVQVANCTTDVLDPLMDSISSGPASSAVADGFIFSFGYSIVSQSPCTVRFRVSVEQSSIEGPGGMFSVLLVGEGTASFD